MFIGVTFPEEAEIQLAGALAGYEIARTAHKDTSNLVPHSGDEEIDAEIVFGQPSVGALQASPRVRWVQLTSAGYTRYAEPSVRELLAGRGVALTTSSSVYAEPCATHAIALTLALLRRLDEAMGEQRGLRAWPSAALRARSAVLAGARVLVLGYGAIGKRLTELLLAFGADPLVLRERPRGDEPVRAITSASLAAELPQADIVISTLPESSSTRGLLGRAHIERMKPRALFINVGRGTTVDQQALANALASGALAGAGLDVTEPEPLPPDHPLWTAPNCLITPHSAGGRHDEHLRLVRHFLDNLKRYERGEALLDHV